MTIVANTSLTSRSDMIAAIRAMQIEFGLGVCSAIDNQSIGQQIVLLQKYLSTVPDAVYPSGFIFDPALVKSNIADHSLPGAIIALQTAYVGKSSIKPAVMLGLNARSSYEGDSITIGAFGPAWTYYDQVKTRGRFFSSVPMNCAVSGKPSNVAVTNIPTVNATHPDIVALMIGTNNTGDGAAKIWADIKTCALGYLNGGSTYVILIPITPRGQGNANSAPSELVRLAVNASIADFANLTVNPEFTGCVPNLRAVPSFDGSFDADTPGADTVDGLHPNQFGANKIGTAVAAVKATLITSADINDSVFLTSNSYLFANSLNPQMIGTAGTKAASSGVVANLFALGGGSTLGVAGSKSTLGTSSSFTGAISGTTLTVSGTFSGPPIQIGQTILGGTTSANTTVTAFVSGTGGLGTYTVSNSQTVTSVAMTATPTAQRILVSGTNGSAGQLVRITQTMTGLTLLTGEVWECGWDVVLATGAQNLRALYAKFTPFSASPNSVKTDVMDALGLTGVLRSSPQLITSDQVNPSIELAMTFALGTCAADLTGARAWVRKVASV